MSKYNDKLNCLDCPKSSIDWDTMDLLCDLTNGVVNPSSSCKSHPYWDSFTCDDCVKMDCPTRGFGWSACSGKVKV